MKVKLVVGVVEWINTKSNNILFLWNINIPLAVLVSTSRNIFIFFNKIHFNVYMLRLRVLHSSWMILMKKIRKRGMNGKSERRKKEFELRVYWAEAVTVAESPRTDVRAHKWKCSRVSIRISSVWYERNI